MPSVQDKIRLNSPVSAVNYEGNKVVVTANGQTYEADKVIVTVPIQILKDADINFTPGLPSSKLSALQNAPIWGGMKVFLEFSQKFYPTFLSFPDSETATGQRLYYDAAYGQNTNANVLGLFSVGQQAQQYQNLSGNALRDYILAELDQIYNGAATQHYIQHVAQNWNQEPFIRQAYLADNASSGISNALATPIANKVYFAGDAYSSFDDWGSVHVAARSARDAVNLVMA